MLKVFGEVFGYDYLIIIVNEFRIMFKVGGVESFLVVDIVVFINIGFREGREIIIGDVLEVKEFMKKEIEYIKRRSCELSGNIMIFFRLVREVVFGNFMFEEVIEIYRRGCLR